MTGSWFHRLEDDARHDWERATSLFHHAAPTIGVDQSQPPHQQERAMSLATIVADIKNLAEEGESRFRTILDEHLPQAAQLAGLIEANPIFASVEAALGVPELTSVVDGFAKALDVIVAAHTAAPAAPPVPEVPAPAAPEQPGEPQPEPSVG